MNIPLSIDQNGRITRALFTAISYHNSELGGTVLSDLPQGYDEDTFRAWLLRYYLIRDLEEGSADLADVLVDAACTPEFHARLVADRDDTLRWVASRAV